MLTKFECLDSLKVHNYQNITAPDRQIVPGQRDKLKILPRDGTGRDSQNPGRDAGQKWTEQKRMF